MRHTKRDLVSAVAALEPMKLGQLREEWERRYGAPPRHRSADLLRRVLAWRMQADVLGGFDATTRRLLEKDTATLLTRATTGTRLARDWAGHRHEVIIIDGGVLYEGATYRSLSEVARHITGKRWNGPRFFGLRQTNCR